MARTILSATGICEKKIHQAFSYLVHFLCYRIRISGYLKIINAGSMIQMDSNRQRIGNCISKGQRSCLSGPCYLYGTIRSFYLIYCII